MRIRLDKLFLSAGLALAVIATTIPVGASVVKETTEATVTGTSGLATSEGKAVTDTTNFVAAITGVSTATSNQSITGVSGLLESKGVGNITTSGAVTDGGAATTDIKNLDTSYTFGAGKAVSAYVITQQTVYETKDYKYTLVNGEVTANTNDDSKNDVDVTADSIEASIVKDLGIKEVTDQEFDYGTKTVNVSNNITSISESATSYKIGDEISISDGETVTVTTTYTVTTLPSGYRYDILLGTVEANKDFVVAVANVDGSEKLVTDYTETDDGILVSTTTLVDNVFYLGTKTVSTSGALLFGPTTGEDDNLALVSNGTDSATITSITSADLAASDEDAKTAIDEYNTANKLELVSYLTITTQGTYSGSALTFKIVTPTDLPAVEDGYTRTYKVIRYHAGEATALETTEEDGYIVFTSDKFSTFALVYEDVAADTTTTEEATDTTTDAATGTTTADSSTTSTTTSTKTADNSMMPLFMTTLLLALCAGSLAIYKEKKTN